eukprot:gene7908-8104_t
MGKWHSFRVWWSRSKVVKWVLRINKFLLTSGAFLAWLAYTASNSWGPHGWIVGLVGAIVAFFGGVLELADLCLRTELPNIDIDKLREDIQELMHENKALREDVEQLKQAVMSQNEQALLQHAKAVHLSVDAK